MHNRNTTQSRMARTKTASILEWEDEELILFAGSDDPLTPEHNLSEWDCFTQDPSPMLLPNGTLITAYRAQHCHPYEHNENVGIAVADKGAYDVPYRRITTETAAFPFGTKNEDPFIWHSSRGYHMLTHNQEGGWEGNVFVPDGRNRGGYAWSHDAVHWTVANTDVSPQVICCRL